MFAMQVTVRGLKMTVFLRFIWKRTGRILEQLSGILKKEVDGSAIVDRFSYAQAFAGLSSAGFPEITDLLSQIRANDVLDIGCGPGSLLIGLAERWSEFRGWGVDANPDMCTAARQRIQAMELDQRVKIFQGNSLGAIPCDLRDAVRAITACSVLNEYCEGDKNAMVQWLEKARGIFPRGVKKSIVVLRNGSTCVYGFGCARHSDTAFTGYSDFRQ